MSAETAVFKIGSRKSDLAMWQANHVCALLNASGATTTPPCAFEVVGIQALGKC
jgi:porphobilinogen deaminase